MKEYKVVTFRLPPKYMGYEIENSQMINDISSNEVIIRMLLSTDNKEEEFVLEEGVSDL